MKIPALTIWQPWAQLIVAGAKTVENRSWPPPDSVFGNTIAIHAGKTFDESAMRLLNIELDPVYRRGIVKTRNVFGGFPKEWPRGAIIGFAELVSVAEPHKGLALSDSDRAWWDDNQWAFVLRNARAIAEPIPIRGHQKFWWWEVPEGVDLG